MFWEAQTWMVPCEYNRRKNRLFPQPLTPTTSSYHRQKWIWSPTQCQVMQIHLPPCWSESIKCFFSIILPSRLPGPASYGGHRKFTRNVTCNSLDLLRLCSNGRQKTIHDGSGLMLGKTPSYHRRYKIIEDNWSLKFLQIYKAGKSWQ